MSMDEKTIKEVISYDGSTNNFNLTYKREFGIAAGEQR